MTRQARDVVLLLGAPGAGKGTQARFLAHMLRVPHVASGDLLREHRRAGTALGLAARAYMDRGELVPDQLVVDMLVDRLDRPDARRGVLLDGFPRTSEQASALDERLQQLASRVRAALYLDVPQPALVERLAGRWTCATCQATYHEVFAPPSSPGSCDVCGGALFQRQDDRREVVQRRVEVYLKDTMPVVERYAERGVLHRTDGDQAVDGVRAELCMALGGAVEGQRRRRWHLFVRYTTASDDETGGRTLCGKIVHPHTDLADGSLAAFRTSPCRTCRHMLRSHRVR